METLEKLLTEALQEYQQTYLPARNLAPRSRREYTTDLTELVDFLLQRGIRETCHVALAHLNAYLAFLDQRNLSGYTRRRKVSSIKSFCKFLTISGYVVKDPSLQLIPPKKESTSPRVLSETEYKRLQLAVANQPLAAAIVEVFLQTGIRLSELANIAIADIQLPQKINKDAGNIGQVHVRKGKGRKDRVLTLNYKACRAIKAYLRVRPEPVVQTDRLFLSKFKKPITPRGVEWIVHKYLDEAGIRGAKVHTLRHTFGTHQVKMKTSLRTVQEMMGHESLETTSIYVGLARDLMDEEIQRNAL
jgi:site-specific recombinase XerD